MAHVVIAGATGYLGLYLVGSFLARGYRVTALARPGSHAEFPPEVRVFCAEATRPETLEGVFDGADIAVSALGITRQTDKLCYDDVDYQANLNLLNAARAANVSKFAYVHVLTRTDTRSDLVAAKTRFVRALQAAPIASLVVRPGGYFSDLSEVLRMARAGRVWLVGRKDLRINPIHGADLAEVVADAVQRGEADIEVGGPEVLTMEEIARLAFAVIDQPARITCVPAWVLRGVLKLIKPLTPRHIWGPLEMFLAASASDMIAPPFGKRRLTDYFAEQAVHPRV